MTFLNVDLCESIHFTSLFIRGYISILPDEGVPCAILAIGERIVCLNISFVRVAMIKVRKI
jgi:hypothetical protein